MFDIENVLPAWLFFFLCIENVEIGPQVKLHLVMHQCPELSRRIRLKLHFRKVIAEPTVETCPNLLEILV